MSYLSIGSNDMYVIGGSLVLLHKYKLKETVFVRNKIRPKHKH